MRGKTLIIILGLAIMAGSTMSVEAANNGASADNNNVGGFSDRGDDGGGGRGDNDRGGGRGNDRGEDRSDHDEGDGRNPRRCLETSVNDCPPPPPRKKKKKRYSGNLTPSEDDCTCRPVPVKINNRTQIVLDCYETRMFRGVKRTYVCKRPPNNQVIR